MLFNMETFTEIILTENLRLTESLSKKFSKSDSLLFKGMYNGIHIFAKIFDKENDSLITEKKIYKYIQDKEIISENYFIKYFDITEPITFNNDFNFFYLNNTIEEKDQKYIFNKLIEKFKNIFDSYILNNESDLDSYILNNESDFDYLIYNDIKTRRYAPSFNEDEYNTFKNELFFLSKSICNFYFEYKLEYDRIVRNKISDSLVIIDNNINIIKKNRNSLRLSIIDIQNNLPKITETIEITGSTINDKNKIYNELIDKYNKLLKSPNYLLFNLDIKYYLYYINNIYKKIILKLSTKYNFSIPEHNKHHFTNYFKFIEKYNLDKNEYSVTILKTNLDNTITILRDNYNYSINYYNTINRLIDLINYENLNLDIIIIEYCNFPTLLNYNTSDNNDLVENFDHFIFELFYGIYVMNEKLNVMHNDTHDKNILLEKNTNEENHTYTFKYDGFNYSFTKKKYYNIKFIDFDNSSVFNKENLITNEKLEEYEPTLCRTSGLCNKKTLKDTLYTILIIIYTFWNSYTLIPNHILNKIKNITNNSTLCDKIIEKMKTGISLHKLCYFKNNDFIIDKCDEDNTDLNSNLNAQILFNIYNLDSLSTSNIIIKRIYEPLTKDTDIGKKYLKYLKYKNKYLKLKNNIN